MSNHSSLSSQVYLLWYDNMSGSDIIDLIGVVYELYMLVCKMKYEQGYQAAHFMELSFVSVS